MTIKNIDKILMQYFLKGGGNYLSIGEKLKLAREELGVDLREVQNNLKIRIRYLEALEKDNFDIIPGEAYIKAFIKSYANYLNLDSNELIKEYKAIKEEEKRKIEEEKEEEEKNKSSSEFINNKTLISSIIVVVIILLLVILIYNVFLLNNSQNDVSATNNNDLQEVTSIEKPELLYEKDEKETNTRYDYESFHNDVRRDIKIDENKTENSNISRNLDSKSNFNSLKEEIDRYENIELIVTEKSWLQISIDGNDIYEGILEKGNIRSFNFADNITMKIGNAAGIKVRKDNEIFGPWGEQGEVIEKIINF